jgi:hypothetical protein
MITLSGQRPKMTTGAMPICGEDEMLGAVSFASLWRNPLAA